MMEWTSVTFDPDLDILLRVLDHERECLVLATGHRSDGKQFYVSMWIGAAPSERGIISAAGDEMRRRLDAFLVEA